MGSGGWMKWMWMWIGMGMVMGLTAEDEEGRERPALENHFEVIGVVEGREVDRGR